MSEEKQAIKKQAKNARGMLPCPFCGKKMILSHKFADHPNGYLKWLRFHPDNECILRAYSIDLRETEKVEAWNTRKPMERIVERLEEFNEGTFIRANGRANGKTLAYGYSKGIEKAVMIVKEEGVI